MRSFFLRSARCVEPYVSTTTSTRPWAMAAAACSTMNSQMAPPCPVESTQLGRRPRYSASSTGGSAPVSDMRPSTSDLSIPASASARVVPWKLSSNAVLSSTRPQSEVDAPTIATRRFGIPRHRNGASEPQQFSPAPGPAPATMGRRPGSTLPPVSSTVSAPLGARAPPETRRAPRPRRRMSEDSSESNAGNEVTRRVEDGVCWITLNRPDAGNAVTQSMRDQIADWVRGASADRFVRVVVITGAGDKAFCSGADLRGGRLPPRPKPDGAPEVVVGEASRMIREGWQALVSSILACEKPVIAGGHGTAAGGGMHLALACDLVVMAEGAKFVEVFIRRGIAPDAGGAWILSRLVGIQKAKELFFFGDDVPAAEAYRIGLVNRLVPRAELQAALEEWAGRLATAPTKAIGVAKWLTNRALDVDRATALHDEAMAQELITNTVDSTEGVASFVERRAPPF